VTYTHPRRFLPRFQPAAAKEALRELALAFLRAYGPATPQHFARWLSAPPGWANTLFDSLGEVIEEVETEGQTALVAAGDLAETAAASAVRLLPYFDTYGIASHPRVLIFPGTAGTRGLNRGQAGNFPLLLVDGIVGGIWNQRRAGKRTVVTIEAFDPLTTRQRRAAGEEAERLGAFLGSAVELVFGEVTAGGHA
jgi:hypothetical protein